MDIVNLLIKPVSSLCNLNCRYCFYHDVSKNRAIKNYGKMSLTVLETLVKRAFEEASQAVVFAFQGGEPTLAGLDFFQTFITYVQTYNHLSLPVSFSIQTNGLFINDEWCSFLKLHHFLIGISLDGPTSLHNHYRIDFQNHGTHAAVMKSIALLKKAAIPFNILTVINRQNSQHPTQLYHFYRKHSLEHIQLIPCIPPIGISHDLDPMSVSPEAYGHFLDQLFQLWYSDILNDKPISIRYFDNLVGIIMGFHPQACELQGYCSTNFVIESNGDVYPCDFYVTDAYKGGSIMEMDLHTIKESLPIQLFLNESLTKSIKCRSCEFYQLCRGGCIRHKTETSSNVFCESYHFFLRKNIRKLESLALNFKKS